MKLNSVKNAATHQVEDRSRDQMIALVSCDLMFQVRHLPEGLGIVSVNVMPIMIEMKSSRDQELGQWNSKT